MLVGVTGGTGFIGRELVRRHIELGDTVRVLSRQSVPDLFSGAGVHVFNSDLTGPVDGLFSFVDGLDVLYNCAAEIKDQSRMAAVHIDGTRNLCSAAGGRISHWVQLSSVGVYGHNLTGEVTEEQPFAPAGIYEQTKAMAEDIVKQAAVEGGFSWSILRPSNVYGPEMSNNSLFQLITAINKGYFFFIGRAGARANYIQVKNVVNGLLLCAQKPAARGRAYNLNDSCSMEEFIGVISDTLGRRNPVPRIPAAIVKTIALAGRLFKSFPLTASRIEALTSRCDYSLARIRNELGYRHQVSMTDGLREMVTKWRQRAGGKLSS